ncbi:peroxiredoxin [Chitinophaga pinensis]|uniref:thioredoxin-dependent peroxiredoxin n=1 Tax=Chitinophaga pinensis TaxID=79329 RepID=A0A5C6LLN5_9BACT|nr:peroxiredoxin [Chitinophaga pinensis]TWV94368.1 peroxiredoxin [Chitinophaga pinensis]
MANTKTLTTGDHIPDFSLQDQNGQLFNIRDYIGKKKLVIYFYPKDESGICTKEACSFRDSYADFTDAGAIVIGINAGSVESHRSFKEHHRLPFTLLSDPGNKVLKQFGIKNVLFLTGRETFLIGLDGKVAASFRGFLKGDAHAEKMLDMLQANV